MSAISPERVEPETLEFESVEFDIVCDISSLRNVSPDFPRCQGGAARWVAWRPNCCPESPRYRLVCDDCKKVYQAWQAKNAYIYCGYCGEDTGGFISFTPLKGAS